MTSHDVGLVEVFLSASNAPLSFPEFESFCFWLDGKFANVIFTEQWMVRQLDINIDFVRKTLDGLTSLSLKAWHNAWARIYQKEKDMIRIEVGMVPDQPLEDVRLQVKDAEMIILSMVAACQDALSGKFVSPQKEEVPEAHHDANKVKESKYDHDPSYA